MLRFDALLLVSTIVDYFKAEDDDDQTQWAVDVSEDAVRARMQDLTDGAKNMTISDDLEKSEKERMDIIYNMVKAKRDADSLESAQCQKEIVNEAERLEIKSKVPLVLAELLFDQNILTQVKKYRLLFLRFTFEDKKAQRYLIGGLEQIIDLHRDQLMNKVPGLLKVFYDMDILGEAAIIDWADKVRIKYKFIFRILLFLFNILLLLIKKFLLFQHHLKQNNLEYH